MITTMDYLKSDKTDNLLRDKLIEITNVIEKNIYANKGFDYDLMAGNSGFMLYCYYYSDFMGVPKFKLIGKSLMNKICSHINKAPSSCVFNYAEGIPGFLNTINHLIEYGYIDIQTVEISDDIDEFIFEICQHAISTGQDDFLYGAGGLFYYLQKKYILFKSSLTKDLLISLTKQLYDRNLASNIFKCPEKYERLVDLGIPHGYSSWLILLSNNFSYDIEPTLSLKMMDNLFLCYKPYLQNKMIDYKKYYFPEFTNIGVQRSNFKSRLGWCYGDIPCLLALIEYDKCKKKELSSKLRAIIQHIALRDDLEMYNVYDACVCHGTSGLAIILKSLFNKYHDKTLLNASAYWKSKILYMSNRTEGPAGFQKRSYANNQFIYTSEFGLLEGITGIGLSIMGLLSDKHDKWKELLLIS